MNRNINKTPVIITDPSQFDTLKPWRPYKFICKSCGKEIVIFSFTPKSIDKAKLMMCGPCRSSYIQKNKSPIIGKGITPFDIGSVNISSTLVKM